MSTATEDAAPGGRSMDLKLLPFRNDVFTEKPQNMHRITEILSTNEEEDDMNNVGMIKRKKVPMYLSVPTPSEVTDDVTTPSDTDKTSILSPGWSSKNSSVALLPSITSFGGGTSPFLISSLAAPSSKDMRSITPTVMTSKPGSTMAVSGPGSVPASIPTSTLVQRGYETASEIGSSSTRPFGTQSGTPVGSLSVTTTSHSKASSHDYTKAHALPALVPNQPKRSNTKWARSVSDH